VSAGKGELQKCQLAISAPQPLGGRHALMRMVRVTSLIRPRGVSRIGSQMRLPP
jgi:hypothetical protein